MGFLFAIVTALFFPGVILRVKSITGGRKGPGNYAIDITFSAISGF